MLPLPLPLTPMTGTLGGLPCESVVSINYHDNDDDDDDGDDDDEDDEDDDTPMMNMTTSPRKIDKATAL